MSTWSRKILLVAKQGKLRRRRKGTLWTYTDGVSHDIWSAHVKRLVQDGLIKPETAAAQESRMVLTEEGEKRLKELLRTTK